MTTAKVIHEAKMKAIMSTTLREIIRDPKKNAELRKGVSKLHSKKTGSDKTEVKIGGKNYEIAFVSQILKE